MKTTENIASLLGIPFMMSHSVLSVITSLMAVAEFLPLYAWTRSGSIFSLMASCGMLMSLLYICSTLGRLSSVTVVCLVVASKRTFSRQQPQAYLFPVEVCKSQHLVVSYDARGARFHL